MTEAKQTFLRFPSDDEQALQWRLLSGLDRCPAELDKRVAVALGWRDIRTEPVKIGNVSEMRATGIPPARTWRDIVPRYAKSQDAIMGAVEDAMYEDYTPRPGLDVYLDWLQTIRLPGERPDKVAAMVYPHARCAALVLTLRGYAPIPGNPSTS